MVQGVIGRMQRGVEADDAHGKEEAHRFERQGNG